MPRSTANSTAIAVLFAMGIGLSAQAEVTVDDDTMQAEGEARAQEMPLLNQLLQSETEAGLDNTQLSCLDGTLRPCADDMPLLTPAGIAVQLGESDGMILAPADQQPYAISPDGQLVPRGGALDEMAAARLAAMEATPETDTKVDPESDTMPGTVRDNTPEASAPEEDMHPAEAEENIVSDNTAEKEEMATDEVMEEIPPAVPPAPTDESASEDQQRQSELAEQLEVAKAVVASDTPAAEPVTIRDSHARQEFRIPAAEAQILQAGRANSMALLNGVLQEEIRTGLTADDLACQDESVRPCAEGMDLVSPKGVTAQVSNDGSIIIGPMDRQQYAVGEDSSLRARGSNTETAKEAAAAVAPSAQALLGDTVTEGEAFSETLTENNIRSSSEDFKTTLSAAIAKASEAQNRNNGGNDDSTSNLAKVALAGLGALAIGQMLGGEREVALNTGDRIVVTRTDGSQQVLKDDNALLRQAGSEIQTENYSDGSSRTVVTRPDGSQIITIRAADLSVLRRIHVAADGTETVLLDETVEVGPVKVADLPPAPRPEITPANEDELRAALSREAAVSRHFTLNQIRSIPEVRNLVAPVDISAITFDTGSAAIHPDQARQLAMLGTVLEDVVKTNPREIFLIEGHTDAVGSATYNLALSDRRAESVALALSEYFNVPPENLIVQGYGEEYLKVPTLISERENRRASVRRITDLLASTQ
ncbi:MAG: OmpA family protein [Paracoccus sp. (in: a-proteobacteria)]